MNEGRNVPRVRQSFASQVLTPRIPNSFNEGFLKGLLIAAIIFPVVNPKLNTPQSRDILRGSCLGIMAVLGIIGWAREAHFRGAGNNFNIHPLRRLRQWNFWHEGFERVRPISRQEGILKGAFFGFLAAILLNVLQIVNPKYLSSMFLPILAGIVGGAVWGEHNAQHPEPPARGLQA